MSEKMPRIVIAGLSGDSGKTIVSLCLLTALKSRGLTIAPFKKGPDYIDAAWMGIASGSTCRNLDTYLVAEDVVAATFARFARPADISVVEGNRGLFDGKDITGTHSTAGLAKLLRAPVLIVIDATKATRTIAALIKGCQVFDSDLNIAGVILNKVAGKRHQKIITEAIAEYCGLPVLGAIPKLGADAELIPGRHLGLIPPAEFFNRDEVHDKLISIAQSYLDIDAILSCATDTPALGLSVTDHVTTLSKKTTIGYFADSVFTFYYPENLEALEREGATLVPISSLSDTSLPEIDALYIGGGFPETHAERLGQNHSLMETVKNAANDGMPIYAECGGLIYLSRTLQWHGSTHAMAGVFPLDLTMGKKPRGHGYTELVVDRENSFFPLGTVIRGHEFHYSGPIEENINLASCCRVNTGVGVGNGRDGLVYKNVLAVYSHIHADGVKDWAAALVSRAVHYAAANDYKPGGGGSLPTGLAAMR